MLNRVMIMRQKNPCIASEKSINQLTRRLMNKLTYREIVR